MPERYNKIVADAVATLEQLSEMVAFTFTGVVVAGVSVIDDWLLLMVTEVILAPEPPTVPFVVTSAPRTNGAKKTEHATHAAQNTKTAQMLARMFSLYGIP